MPSGVSPNLFMMRSESEPWLVPILIDTPRSRQRSTTGLNFSSIRSNSSAYCASEYSRTPETLLICEVTRVDPHLVGVQCGLHRGSRAEMDVGHERHVHAHSQQPPLDLAQRACIGRRWRGNPHDLATHLHKPQRLSQRGLDIFGQRGSHRLHPDRVVATHAYLAHHHLARLAPAVGIGIRHVRQLYRAADRIHIQCCIQYIIPCRPHADIFLFSIFQAYDDLTYILYASASIQS